MDNKYDKYFSENMTTKQVDLMYYRLEDKVERGSEEEKELDEAYSKAWDASWKQECRYMREVEKNMPKGMTCVVCM